MVAVAPLACDNFRPRNKLTVTTFPDMKIPMIGRTIAAFAVLTSGPLMPATTRAQDVPGIEICTAEKTMERRTSCLQSNVDFLQKTIAKLAADHQQKLDAANRQIEALKVSLAGLQKIVSDLQAAEKATEDAKKKAAPAAAKDAPAAKDSPAAK
jgi:septal ring factor EnvC (AmiA/AmiB activator)